MKCSVDERVRPRGTTYRVRWLDHGRSMARTFTTREAAERWKAIFDAAGPEVALRLLDDEAAGAAAKEDLTVARWVGRHIDSLTGVTEGTKSDYRTYLAKDIAPGRLGLLPLPGLTREVVGQWVNDLAARGLSGKSIRNRHSLLSAAMTNAVRSGHVAANPCKGIRLPRTDHLTAEMVLLSPGDQEELLRALPARWQPLVFTLLHTGMRWGEATALQVQDVHLAGGRQEVRVRRAFKHTDSRVMEVGPPKSKRGTRTVALDAATAEHLRPLLAGRPGSALVFTAPRGGPVKHSTFHGDVWRLALDRAGLDPRPRIHDLRHTHASMLIAAGVPLTYLQRRLGHESITTTSDTYGSLLPDAHEAMIAALAVAFPDAARAIGGAPAALLPPDDDGLDTD